MILSLALAAATMCPDLSEAECNALTPGERQDRSTCVTDGEFPGDFCVIDRRHDRLELALKKLLKKIPAAIRKQEDLRAEFKSFGTKPTFEFSGSNTQAFKSSQKAWDISFRSDCVLVGLAVQSAPKSTAAVTANWQCETDRIAARIEFLQRTYGINDEMPSP